MNTYKITNITDSLGKRSVGFNSVLDIDYVDAMMKKTIKIKPTETIYLRISSLPMSVHQLRAKKLISVIEISNTELNKKMNPVKPVEVKTNIDVIYENEKKNIANENKKRSKKIHETSENE